MAKQATHSGECQMCGRTQKLPGGTLAKHGYTTRWGFFSGVCGGAHHLPYEQSCDQLRALLPTIQAQVAQQHELAAKARATTDAAWVREQFQPAGTKWHSERITLARLVPVAELTHSVRYGHGVVSYTHSKPEQLPAHSKPEHEFRYDQGLTLEGAVALLNEHRAAEHDAHAKRLQEYADWCAERIAKWTPRELKPVVAR